MTAPEHLRPGESVPRAAGRGALCRCPRCGDGPLFGRYLKVRAACSGCGLAFEHHRADDFPPYIVMFAVGHLVGYGIYFAETRWENIPVWLHAALWPSLAIGLSLSLLQPVKGAVVGLQYGLGMHGFGRPEMRERERRADGTTDVVHQRGDA